MSVVTLSHRCLLFAADAHASRTENQRDTFHCVCRRINNRVLSNRAVWLMLQLDHGEEEAQRARSLFQNQFKASRKFVHERRFRSAVVTVKS